MAGLSFDPRAFARLAEELHRAETVPRTAEQIVDYARELTGADEGGITMIRRGQTLQTIAPTAEVVERIDQLQYELSEGPCYDSTWDQRTLVASDLGDDPRWPRWSSAVVGLGISSVLAVELSADERRIGAVNLYSKRPRRFDEDEVALAHLFARHAAVALSGAEKITGLRTALDSRKLIGQAEGILMERYGIDGDRAFEVLRRYSQNSNLKLRAVAEMVVDGRRLIETDPVEGDGMGEGASE